MMSRLERFAPVARLIRNFRLVLLIGFTGLLMACGGSSGEDPEPARTFRVVAVSPGSETAELPVSTSVAVEFSEPLLATTVNAENVVLSVAGEAVASEVRLAGEGSSLLLTPEQPLTLLRRYTVTLSGDIRNVDGTRLGEDYHWRFTTEDGQWSGESVLHQSVGSRVQAFRLVAPAAGPAQVVWSERAEGGAYKTLWAQRLDELNGTVPSPVQIGEGGANVVRWELASNSTGDVIVAWLQVDDEELNLYTRTYVVQDGQWGSIEMAAGNLVLPELQFFPAVSDTGEGLLAWAASDRNAGRMQLFVRHRLLQAGHWSEAVEVNPAVEHAFAPRLVFGGDGTATLLYLAIEMGSANSDLLAQRYTPDDGWLAPKVMSQSVADHWTHTLTANAEGKVVVLWQEAEPMATRLQARQYVPQGMAGGWQPAASLLHDAGAYNGYALHMDESGNVALMWSYRDGGVDSPSTLLAGYFVAAENQWQAGPVVLGQVRDGWKDARLAGNERGDLVAAWIEPNASDSQAGALVSRRFDPVRRRWSDRATISASEAFKGTLSVALDSAGHSHAVWSGVFEPDGQAPGVMKILVSRFNGYSGNWSPAEVLGERERTSIGSELSVTGAGPGWVLWGSAARYDSDLIINRFRVPFTAQELHP